ncbi:hypothetical protein GCM10012283_26670 [Phycicoccus endophyticus]|nr:hypothetical protein GCM10012283_26670 [Phycicoccus endophyticus]
MTGSRANRTDTTRTPASRSARKSPPKVTATATDPASSSTTTSEPCRDEAAGSDAGANSTAEPATERASASIPDPRPRWCEHRVYAARAAAAASPTATPAAPTPWVAEAEKVPVTSATPRRVRSGSSSCGPRGVRRAARANGPR